MPEPIRIIERSELDALEAERDRLLESLRWAMEEVAIGVPLSEQPDASPALLRTYRCIWCECEGEWPKDADVPSIEHKPDCPWLLAMQRAGLEKTDGK